MKRIFKKIPLESWLAILAAVLIVILVQAFPRYHTLQYLEDGELQTESFRGREEFSKRAKQLRADGIKYWLYLED